MAQLVPCSRCSRHVRGDACPFCGATLDAAPTSALGRSSRAALLALAASAPLAACTPSPAVTMYGGPPIAAVDAAAAPSASSSAAPAASGGQTTQVSAYGGPPPITPEPQIAPKR